jgi:hypothetical protein
MTPTNCKKILTLYRSSGECEQPETEAAGYHYEFLEYRPGDRINGFVWALVPDDALASSPTDAEIARRVDLLIELEPALESEDIASVRKQARRVAIRQLLAERGAK